MLIQCHTCHTKYRLNLERIPNKKTFVKCKKCGTPIYIDAQSDAAPEAAPVAAPPMPRTPPPEQVTCDRCGTRYNLPAAARQRPNLRLKCTQCGNTFPLDQPPPAAPPEAPRPAAPTPDFYPESTAVDPTRGMSALEREMPLPDEDELEGIFDDLGAGEEPGEGQEPEPFESAPLGAAADGEEFDAEAAYREATALDDEDLPPAPRGTVPDEQKYQIFMRPGSGKPAGATPPPEDMPMADEPDSLDLPSMDDGMAPAEDATARREAADEAMPAFADDGGLPPPPAEHIPLQERLAPAPGQDKVPPGEHRTIGIIAAALAAVLAIGVYWGFTLYQGRGPDAPYTVMQGEEHHLSLEGKLDGRYVINAKSGQRMFVVDGKVVNRFPPSEELSWVRIKGSALADPDDQEPLQVTYSYIGNVLTREQLERWDLQEIKAFYGYNNGRNDSNFQIPTGKAVAFQLVFTGIEQPVRRTVAQVASYTRSGQQVIVNAGP